VKRHFFLSCNSLFSIARRLNKSRWSFINHAVCFYTRNHHPVLCSEPFLSVANKVIYRYKIQIVSFLFAVTLLKRRYRAIVQSPFFIRKQGSTPQRLSPWSICGVSFFPIAFYIRKRRRTSTLSKNLVQLLGDTNERRAF
jgi:hypothetical protein